MRKQDFVMRQLKHLEGYGYNQIQVRRIHRLVSPNIPADDIEVYMLDGGNVVVFIKNLEGAFLLGNVNDGSVQKVKHISRPKITRRCRLLR